ncbi:MAG TPA: hypothetical protein VJB08_03065 [Candidatus Nanoarchaeia archaeon]|nr:hypothetical protein [Candidatus Nanoarchaeia archaeon]
MHSPRHPGSEILSYPSQSKSKKSKDTPIKLLQNSKVFNKPVSREFT